MEKPTSGVFFFSFFITICGWEAKDYTEVEEKGHVFRIPPHNNVAGFNFRRRIRDPMAIMTLLL